MSASDSLLSDKDPKDTFPSREVTPPPERRNWTSTRRIEVATAAAGWWRPLAFVLALFLASVLFALGHHLFNASLNGNPVSSADESRLAGLREGSFRQDDALRIGTALAMLFKLCLGSAIGLALLQRAWRTVRSTALSVDGVDALFAVPHSFFAIFERDLWRGAVISIVLASVLWVLPLVTVVPTFNAGSLTENLYLSRDSNITDDEGPEYAGTTFGNSSWFGGDDANSCIDCPNYNGHFALLYNKSIEAWEGLLPLDENTRASISYEAIKDSLYAHLNGTVSVSSQGITTAVLKNGTITFGESFTGTSVDNVPETLDVALSALAVNHDNLTWVHDLPRAIEQLMHNVTLSLVANGNYLGNPTTLNATLVGTHTIFHYTPTSLWISYAIGILLGAVCCLDGLFSLLKNGSEGKMGFWAFVETSQSLTSEAGVTRKSRTQYGPLEDGHGFEVVRDKIEGTELRARTSRRSP
ncbi:hypothetical protein RQP46_008502 [Phenoliferia psychrophenolica]